MRGSTVCRLDRVDRLLEVLVRCVPLLATAGLALAAILHERAQLGEQSSMLCGVCRSVSRGVAAAAHYEGEQHDKTGRAYAA
jgi:hypothetical protein